MTINCDYFASQRTNALRVLSINVLLSLCRKSFVKSQSRDFHGDDS